MEMSLSSALLSDPREAQRARRVVFFPASLASPCGPSGFADGGTAAAGAIP